MIEKYIKANKTAIKLLKMIRDAAENASMSEKQMITLYSVDSGNTTFGMLSKHTGILVPSLALIIKKLMEKGMVVKTKGNGEFRSNVDIIEVTIRGRRALRELEK